MLRSVSACDLVGWKKKRNLVDKGVATVVNVIIQGVI